MIINHGSIWFHNIYIPPIPASHQAVPVGRSPWVARWILDVFQFLQGKKHQKNMLTRVFLTCFSMFFHPVLGPDGLRHGVTGTVRRALLGCHSWGSNSMVHQQPPGSQFFFQHTETAKKSEKKHHVAETA